MFNKKINISCNNTKGILFTIVFIICIIFSNLAIAGTSNNNSSTNNNTNKKKKELVIPPCPYKDKFYECLEANGIKKDGETITGSTNTSRMIDDFICIDSKNPTDILTNIIIDEEFSKIEKDMKNFLITLGNNKTYYFSEDPKNNEITGIDDIEKIFGDTSSNGSVFGYKYGNFYNRFYYICNLDFAYYKVMECKGSASIEEVKNIISNNFKGNRCMAMAEKQLDIYKNAALNILRIDKAKVMEDDIAKYKKILDKKYDNLFQMFIQNLDYIWTILNNWISKTRECI